MSTGGDIEENIFAGFIEHWRNDSDIWQVSTTVVRCVQHVDVTDFYGFLTFLDDRFYAFAHRPEVHWNVGCVCYQGAVRVENCTRKVQPFFNVDRIGSILEYFSHLLC